MNGYLPWLAAASIGLSACASSNVIVVDPSAEQGDLSSLEGDWDGTLRYLDYGDNESYVSLKTQATYRLGRDQIKTSYAYTEPNGEIINDKGSIKLSSDGTVAMDGLTYRILDIDKEGDAPWSAIRMEAPGVDNGSPGMITITIAMAGDALTITKDVLLEGETDPYTRNEYAFQRVE